MEKRRLWAWAFCLLSLVFLLSHSFVPHAHEVLQGATVPQYETQLPQEDNFLLWVLQLDLGEEHLEEVTPSPMFPALEAVVLPAPLPKFPELALPRLPVAAKPLKPRAPSVGILFSGLYRQACGLRAPPFVG